MTDRIREALSLAEQVIAGVIRERPETDNPPRNIALGVVLEKVRTALDPSPQAPAQPDMRKVCEALGFDPTNHHNAAKCPYCRPTAQPAPQDELAGATHSAMNAIHFADGWRLYLEAPVGKTDYHSGDFYKRIFAIEAALRGKAAESGKGDE